MEGPALKTHTHTHTYTKFFGYVEMKNDRAELIRWAQLPQTFPPPIKIRVDHHPRYHQLLRAVRNVIDLNVSLELIADADGVTFIQSQGEQNMFHLDRKPESTDWIDPSIPPARRPQFIKLNSD